MDIEAIIDLIKKFVDLDTLIGWVGSKLINEYGINDMEVKRVRDAVILIIKGDDENLNKIEKELRSAVSKMGFSDYKVEVEIE